MRLLLLACFALFATDASAQLRAATMSPSSSGSTNARYTLTGPTTTTAISGNNGTTSTNLQGEDSNSILYRLSTSERNDDPCNVSAQFWTAPSGFQASTSSGGPNFEYSNRDSWAGCTWNQRSQKTLVAQFPPNSGVYGDGGAAAIHGIQVCTNDRNGSNLKVKGIKILVSVMNQDGQGRIVRSGSFAESFERPNCRSWEQVRRCPQGQVATGLQVFHRGDNMTGLALKCRRVTVTPL